jgi:hypothetical protein
MFFTSETPFNVSDVAAPMHVARPKGSNSQKKLEAIIIKILNKKGLKIKKSACEPGSRW